MILQRQHPEVATRDCQTCLQFVFGEDGRLELDSQGHPIPRAKKSPAPCRSHMGCPKGTPEEPKSLSERNQRFLREYQIAKLTGRWPDDRWFLELAARVKNVEDTLDRADQERMMANLIAAGAARGV